MKYSKGMIIFRLFWTCDVVENTLQISGEKLFIHFTNLDHSPCNSKIYYFSESAILDFKFTTKINNNYVHGYMLLFASSLF